MCYANKMSTSTKSLEKEKIHHENLKPGYIYKTTGNVSSLFIGHVSTLKLEPRMLVEENKIPTIIPDSDFLDRKKSKVITDKTKSFGEYRIITKYVEYGTLWFNFTYLNKWLLQHPDLASTESISEIERGMNPTDINLYDYSIRTKVLFVEPLVDHRFQVPFDSIYSTLRDKAGSNITRRRSFFEHWPLHKSSTKIANSKITLLANMTPLGNYPQLNSCFNDWSDLFINKKTK